MKNVLEWLEASESVFPDKAVYMEDSKEITFHDVLCTSQKIGTVLADVNGAAPIAVISGRKVETITAYLGIVYSGHAYAPIDGKLPRHRIDIIVETLKPSAILADSDNLALAEELAQGIPVFELEKAMKENNTEAVSPSMCYAYAAIAEGAPFIMGAPNLCVDTPAMWEFSKKMNVPISGKDFKSGQTLMKTVLAPMFKTRMLGVSGWFSTNILGNRDGEVLDDPANFKTKEVSKLSVIDNIFEPEKFPDLYGDVYHKVRINYYPPRKDNKEAWDNIDIFGWMGYPMEIKVNFLCRDSILAAPIALDLVLFSDLALRAGMYGIQTWLSFFCKSPMHDFEHQPVHDLFQQWRMVKQTLRDMIGEKAPNYLD